MKKQPRQKRRSTQKGSLVVIATLLISSAVLRIGEGAGQAFARDPDNDAIANANGEAMGEDSTGGRNTLVFLRDGVLRHEIPNQDVLHRQAEVGDVGSLAARGVAEFDRPQV